MKKVLILFVLVVVFMQNAEAIGIGISPAELKLDDGLKGSEYIRSFTVINPTSEMNNYTFFTEGEIKGWIEFYDYNKQDEKINSLEISADNKSPVLIKINIPHDAINGNYSGKIIVRTTPTTENDGSSGSTMIVGVPLAIKINVTGNQIIEGVVTGILVHDNEINYPIRIETLFRNYGNVVVAPKINIQISQDGNNVDSFTYEDSKVSPGELKTIETKWETKASNVPGDYIATVTVSLEGRKLESENLPFKLFPIGTLTRRGNLTDILIEGDRAVGSLVKVNAHFQNTGEIDTDAKFVGEVYKDGVLVDKITSEELHVEKYMSTVLVSYLKLESTGDYLIKGKVIYSGKETPVKEVSLKAGKSTPGFEGIYLIAVMLLFVMFRGKKKSRKM